MKAITLVDLSKDSEKYDDLMKKMIARKKAQEELNDNYFEGLGALVEEHPIVNPNSLRMRLNRG